LLKIRAVGPDSLHLDPDTDLDPAFQVNPDPDTDPNTDTDSDPIQIQGFNEQKLKKKIQI
jgi:hypothetical protein